MLRDYQQRAIEMVRERAKERPLLVMPTGSGKTVVAAEIIRMATQRGKRSIFLVHRQELLDQAVKRLARVGIRAGKIIGRESVSPSLPVQVASIPTLVRRDHVHADVVFVDECSFAMAKTWRECIDRYKDSVVIGLTATPLRLDGKGLGALFGCILEPVTTRELIERGHIIEPRVFAPPVDLTGIKIVAGDYQLPMLAERMTKLVGSITGTWLKHAACLKTIACAVNREHSQAIADAFNAIGVKAAHVDYKVPKRKREKLLYDWMHGDIEIVSQVDLFSYGFDFPDLHCAILARPTKSIALFRQQVGRIVRPPGPAICLDHAGNHIDHGLITAPIEWSLDSPVKRTATGPAVRTCAVCFAVIAPGLDACPACGAACVRASEGVTPQVENPGELVLLDMTPKFEKATPDAKDAAYRELVAHASVHGYKLGWARNQYKKKFGVWPKRGETERELYLCPGKVMEDRPAAIGSWKIRRCANCLQLLGSLSESGGYTPNFQRHWHTSEAKHERTAP